MKAFICSTIALLSSLSFVAAVPFGNSRREPPPQVTVYFIEAQNRVSYLIHVPLDGTRLSIPSQVTDASKYTLSISAVYYPHNVGSCTFGGSSDTMASMPAQASAEDENWDYIGPPQQLSWVSCGSPAHKPRRDLLDAAAAAAPPEMLPRTANTVTVDFYGADWDALQYEISNIPLNKKPVFINEQFDIDPQIRAISVSYVEYDHTIAICTFTGSPADGAPARPIEQILSDWDGEIGPPQTLYSISCGPA